MTRKNSGLQPMASAILAVSSLLSSYEALASQQVFPRPAVASVASTSRVPTLKAVETDHQKAMKRLKNCISKFIEINRNALSHGFPEHMLTDEQTANLANLLSFVREVEARIRGTKVPSGLEAGRVELRRALAEARSEVAVTFSLVRQIRGTPEEFEGRVSMDAVKALADRSAQRLLEMAKT